MQPPGVPGRHAVALEGGAAFPDVLRRQSPLQERSEPSLPAVSMQCNALSSVGRSYRYSLASKLNPTNLLGPSFAVKCSV